VLLGHVRHEAVVCHWHWASLRMVVYWKDGLQILRGLGEHRLLRRYGYGQKILHGLRG
jgi:hypothetical protein